MPSSGASTERLPGRTGMARLSLPATPVSCRLAREFVLSVTGGREDPRVALVVTELVSNAVVHGQARPELRVGWDGRTLEVEVEDDGPGRPELQPLDPTSTTGRGLALVDRVADDWGVGDPKGGGPTPGKVVWARINLGA